VLENNPEQTLSNLSQTTLTAWFRLNSEDPNARQLLYPEIPRHYVWDTKSKTWYKRKRTNKPILARLVTASPADMERYCLRMILLHVRGATSFNYLLRKWNDPSSPVCSSFRESAIINGLLSDDKNWRECLEEAASYSSAKKLRNLFCLICALCYPSNPKELWELFKESMKEDFMYRTQSENVSMTLCIREIETLLLAYENPNLTLRSLGIDVPLEEEILDDESTPEMSISENVLIDERIESLNYEQRQAFEAIRPAIENADAFRPSMFYLDGPGGSGKTYLYNTLIKFVESKGSYTINTAFTGIAASLLINGTTIHKRFQIPMDGEHCQTLSISPSSSYAEYMKKARLFIFDEASMIPSWIVDYIDKLLRDIMDINIPFGGKPVMFGGDFRQCLPVIKSREKGKILASCMYSLLTTLVPIHTDPIEKEYANYEFLRNI
jgi:hypothetical protein